MTGRHNQRGDSGAAAAPESTRLPLGADADAEQGASDARPAEQGANDAQPAEAQHATDGHAAPSRATAQAAAPRSAATPAADLPARPLPEDDEQAEAAGRSDDHERKVELDLEELEARAEKADEYLELAQRTKADFENYRKRAAREVAAAQERGITKLARELLPAIDNLERALTAAEADSAAAGESGDTLASGIKLVQAELVAALGRVGIEPFSPVGQRFDPQRHEAIAQQPVEGAEPGTVVEVYQRGYVLGESVLRPARVVVAG